MSQARNPAVTAETRKQIAQLEQLGWYHSIELPDGGVIKGFQTLDQLRLRIAQFPIPQDLRGKRVLDIGASDGWFSFEMERRGAQVVAVDSARDTRFLAAKELLGSKVEHHVADICRLSPADFGYFDIVLFFGVLYHLKHPLLALEKVCELATDMACVESYVTDDGSNPDAPPLMEFYETTELRGQFDNWVGPNVSCLMAFCRAAGFATVRFQSVLKERAHVVCHRKWPEVRATEPGPFLTCVENSVSRDHHFSSTADDYLAFWFKTDRRDLGRNDVFPQVGPYGSQPVGVFSTGGDGWHVNCKLPPGLGAGWHEARLRLADTEFSNAIRIGVDLSDEARRAPASGGSEAVRIALATDGKTWDRYRVRVGAGSCISLWLAGLPEDSDKRDIRVRLNGADLPATFLSQPDREGLRQVNALMPSGLQPGEAMVTLLFRDAESEGVNVVLFRD